MNEKGAGVGSNVFRMVLKIEKLTFNASASRTRPATTLNLFGPLPARLDAAEPLSAKTTTSSAATTARAAM